jgi:tRNA-Thr(GGU) m(6)t(6)A37 methyltransferase TsaA
MEPEKELFSPVARIHSCYGEKFGIPRQAGLAPSAEAWIELLPPLDTPDALREIEAFSHLWILFLFHASERDPSKTTARPPRLGGNQRVGVFASRSPYRPNPIGLSAVELVKVEGSRLLVRGGDFLDGTPVLDIKPYIPYSDSIPKARGGYADTPPKPQFSVQFSKEAEQALKKMSPEKSDMLRQLLHEMLAYDPRPAYLQAAPDRSYGTRVLEMEIKWQVIENKVIINAIESEAQ